MNDGVISYRLKSELKSDIISFPGNYIKMGDLKKELENKRMRKNNKIECFKRGIHYDFNIYESETSRKITNEEEIIPSNSSVLIERVPIEYAAITYISKDLSKLSKSSKKKNSFQTKKTGITSRPIETQKSTPTQINSSIKEDEFQMENQHRPMQKSPIKAYFTKDEILESFKKARFFIIRSSNLDNIHISQTCSEWATTRSNEGRLNEAYNSSPHVFLIFAVSKIYEFKGFARMSSQITNKMNVFWKNIQTIKLGGCFKVTWITNSPLSFHRIGNMTNPYNDNELIKKSRDCTELEPSVGGELCKMFEVPYRDPNVSPDGFITRANQNFIVKSGNGGLKIPVPIAQQVKNVLKIEKEIKVENSDINFSLFVKKLIEVNPKLPEVLPKMDKRDYNNFIYKLGDIIDDYDYKYKRRKRDRGRDRGWDRGRDRGRERERDRGRDRDDQRKRIKKGKKSKKYKKKDRDGGRSRHSRKSSDS